ncbi:MAG: hemolysin family protein, partial [bacterium]
ALFSLGRIKLKSLQEKSRRRGGLVDELLSHPRQLLITILVGNEIVNIAASSATTSLFIGYFGLKGIWLSIMVMTLLIMTFGEISPKTLAVYNPVRFSLIIADPLYLFYRIITPVRQALDFLLKKLPFLDGEEGASLLSRVTEDEFRTLVEVGEKEGVLDDQEKVLIDNVMEFADTRTERIMVKRGDIFALPSNMTTPVALDRIKRSFHSRVPVYKKGLDQVQGIVYTKDLLAASFNQEKPGLLIEHSHPPYFVTRNRKIMDILREFRRRKVHLAVVIDEHGRTVGLVTMDDILEELFGKMPVTGEKTDRLFIAHSSNLFTVSGMMQIDDFNETVGADLSKEDSETIGGFLFTLKGRAPYKGERFAYQGINFVIKRVRKNKLLEIRVSKQ